MMVAAWRVNSRTQPRREVQSRAVGGKPKRAATMCLRPNSKPRRADGHVAGQPVERRQTRRRQLMAIKATIYKAGLQIADMDRSLYATHQLTLARQPSETDERMMVRLLAFALHVPADDHDGALLLARGLSDTDEPDLWQHDRTGVLLHWIEVGLPDDRRLAKACGRSNRVTLYFYAQPPRLVAASPATGAGHLTWGSCRPPKPGRPSGERSCSCISPCGRHCGS